MKQPLGLRRLVDVSIVVVAALSGLIILLSWYCSPAHAEDVQYRTCTIQVPACPSCPVCHDCSDVAASLANCKNGLTKRAACDSCCGMSGSDLTGEVTTLDSNDDATQFEACPSCDSCCPIVGDSITDDTELRLLRAEVCGRSDQPCDPDAYDPVTIMPAVSPVNFLGPAVFGRLDGNELAGGALFTHQNKSGALWHVGLLYGDSDTTSVAMVDGVDVHSDDEGPDDVHVGVKSKEVGDDHGIWAGFGYSFTIGD